MKHKIRIYYQTFTTHEIEANNPSDAADLAKKEVLAHLKEKSSEFWKEIMQNIEIPSEGWLDFGE